MPRPKKCRRICALPQCGRFGPLDTAAEPESRIKMTLDEYETIRLIDLLGCTQEECAARMAVARTTVQAVYNAARQKLADALVNGKILTITGGDYILCPRARECCGRNCGGRRCASRCEGNQTCDGGCPNENCSHF